MEEHQEPVEKKIKIEYDELDDVCTVEEQPDIPTMLQSVRQNPTLMLDFAGPCNFGYFFPNDGASPLVNSGLYSQVLGQVFIRMGNVVHIQFTIDESKAPSCDLFVRATPIYCSADFMHLPVNRCTLHSLEDDPMNLAHKDGKCNCVEHNLVGHVIRSTSAHAIYCFNESSGRHSVLVPIKHKMYDLLFNFSCKSSCSRGMDRRPIRVAFSLEDGNGLILGSCSVNVKICTCPKRDMCRAERDRASGGRHTITQRKRHLLNKLDDMRNTHPADISSSNPTGSPKSLQPSSSEKEMRNGKIANVDRVKKLKNDLISARAHISKLKHLCTSIEDILDTMDSDI